jgi:parallel beta-helix repeat protein
VTIEGFTLTHGAHGVIITGPAQITLRQNRILENIFAGISINSNGSVASTITGNSIEGNGQEGIRIFEKSTTRIMDNIVQGNGEIDIFVGIDAIAEVSNNKIVGNGHDGIHIDMSSTAMVRENIIRMNGSDRQERICGPISNGIVVKSNSQIELNANTIQGNRPNGIFVEDLIATVMDNTITDHMLRGINIKKAFAILPLAVTGNTIGGNKGGGRLVSEVADELTITNNQIIRNSDEGIKLVETSMAVIMYNTISGTGDNSYGIEIRQRASAAVTGNIIGANGDDGIFVSHETAQITMNIISDNQRWGVHIENTSRATIVDNIVRENGGDSESSGISIVRGTNADLARNIIRSNIEEGWLVIKEAAATINNNEICANTLDGILLQEGSSVMLMDNTVCENRGDGIQIGGDSDLPDVRSLATIRGGTITQNIGNGVFICSPSEAKIGLDGGVIRATGNGGLEFL